jgi:hypothetical protein
MGCLYARPRTNEMDMAMGRVVVNPDLPVGAVIATQNWTMPQVTALTIDAPVPPFLKPKLLLQASRPGK